MRNKSSRKNDGNFDDDCGIYEECINFKYSFVLFIKG